MKYKVIWILGLLCMVLGVAVIILELTAHEKSVVRSIAAGATPITIGSMLIAISVSFERRKNSSRS